MSAKASKIETKANKKSAKVNPEMEQAVAAAATDEDEEEDLIPQISSANNAPKPEDMNATGNLSKNFRNHPDMENFYRFIYEHDLRLEALQIIDEMLIQRQAAGGRKRAKKALADAPSAVQ